jgi:hypothetical protein
MRIVIGLALWATLSASAAASSVRKDFEGIWSAREADYSASEQASATQEHDDTLKFVETFKSNGPTLAPDFQSLMAVSFSHAQATARYKLLKEFEAFMATKPSAAGGQARMQGKIAQVQPAVAPAAAEETRLASVKIGIDEPAGQWVQEKARAAQISGMLSGLVAELTLIDQNLRSFYEGRSIEQQQASETRRRILGGLAAGLAAAAAATPPPPRNFSVMCTQTGSFTNCNGSR